MQMHIPTSLKAKLFQRFGDPSRLAILEALVGGPMSVSEIVASTGLSQPNASNHLHCLHCCGIVNRKQEGRWVFYSLSDPRIAYMLELANDLMSDVTRGVATCTRYGVG